MPQWVTAGLNSTIGYFDAESFHRNDKFVAYSGKKSAPKSGWWVFVLYISVWLGVAAKIYLIPTQDEAAYNTGPFWKQLIISAILATVVFPSVYKETMGKTTLPWLLKLATAFGGGFGFKALVDASK